MRNRLAHSVSVLLHPIWMPLYVLAYVLPLLVRVGQMCVWQCVWVVALTVALAVLLPLLVVFVMKRCGWVSGFEMDNRRERGRPYMVVLLFYVLLVDVLSGLNYTPYLILAYIGMMIAIAVLWLVNHWWKISAHLCGIGGLCGVVMALEWLCYINSVWLFVLLFLAAGVLAWARVECRAHTLGQVAVGFVAGFACGFLPFVMLFKIF